MSSLPLPPITAFAPSPATVAAQLHHRHSTFAVPLTTKPARRPTTAVRPALPVLSAATRPDQDPAIPLIPTSTTRTPRRRIRPSTSARSKSVASSPSPSRPSSTTTPISFPPPPPPPDAPKKFPPNPALRRQVCATFSRAKQCERAGNLKHARHLLHHCLSLDPRDAHSWLALARLEARLPPTSQDEDTNTHVTSRSDVNTNQSLNSQSNFVSPVSTSSRPATARAIFERGLMHCPDNIHLLHAWAVHEHRVGDSARARTLFERALVLDPQNPYVSQAWGLLEQRAGNVDVARRLFAASVAGRPHPEVCTAWAVLEARDGNIDKARDLFRQGETIDGVSPGSRASIFRAWAETEERVGDLPRARDLLTKAISAQPTHADAYVALARLEARRGGTTRAIELMRAAVDLSPKAPPMVFNAWANIEWTMCGRVDEARAILERGHRLHPQDPALLQTLGTLEERVGAGADAAKVLYKRSIKARPTAPAFVAWALLEERNGSVDEAQRLFEEALATDALHGVAYNAYGRMEARRGELDAARKVYERGLEVAASASVFHGFGQLELRHGRNPARARELFRRGAMLSREDTSFIWHSWGMMELSGRAVANAREVFDGAMKRYPRNSRVLVGAALAAAASSRTVRSDENRARALFKQAVAADPTHAHAWQTWGVFELRRGRVDAAVALFRRGLRLCPRHGALWQAWGVLETNRGDFGRARQLFRRGAEACPGHVHVFQAWACMEVRAGSIDRARELLDEALKSDSSHGPVWNAYGLLEARHGTLARARQNFMTGIRRSAYHAPLYRTFGQTEAEAGHYDRARYLFEEGLRVDPLHAPLYHALAKFEAMIGNVDGLAKLREKAEKYFGSEEEAVRAMNCGEEGREMPAEVEGCDEHIDSWYESKATPMELALDGNVEDQ